MLKRSVALVGLMGAGKTTVGRRLAEALDAPFRDSDDEIAAAAGRSIPEIFEELGEAAFREGERRVIARLLEGAPHVLATGGGAFMRDETRAAIGERAVSVWLSADLDTLVERTARKPDQRPLLRDGDPRAILDRLMTERYPVYARADLTVDTPASGRQEEVAARIVALLRARGEVL